MTLKVFITTENGQQINTDAVRALATGGDAHSRGRKSTPALTEFVLDEAITIIGSDAQAASIYLPDRNIAPEHAIIVREEYSPPSSAQPDAQLILINRIAGTRYNDETLEREARRELFHGDQLLLGRYVLTFVFAAYDIRSSDDTSLMSTHAQPLAVEASTAPPDFVRSDHPAAVMPDEVETASDRETLHDSPVITSAPSSPQSSPTVVNRNDADKHFAEDIAAAEERESTSHDEPTAQRSFETILNNLRTEEDSYHFRIIGGRDNGRRIVITKNEMQLGWENDGASLAFSAERMATLRATVRKEWSGVDIHVITPSLVYVNDQPIEGVYRLRNEDQISLVAPPASGGGGNNNSGAQRQQIIITFHEPASLVALSAMLPQNLPPPVRLDAPHIRSEDFANATDERNNSAGDRNAAMLRGAASWGDWLSSRQKILGYYPLEWFVMTIGTLAAAVIIFLVLELTA